jgi:hypothetical protein
VNLQFFSIVFLLEEVEEVEILAIRKGHDHHFDFKMKSLLRMSFEKVDLFWGMFVSDVDGFETLKI